MPPSARPATTPPRRSANGTKGRTTSETSPEANTFTAYGTNSPLSASRTISATVVPALSCASRVDAPRCGVTTTFGSPNRENRWWARARRRQRGATEVAVLEDLRECVLVHDPTPGGVHEASATLHQAELGLAEETFGFLRSWQVDADEVRLDQQGLERGHHLHAHLLGPLGRDVGIEGDHAHPEPPRARRDQRPDPSQTEETERSSPRARCPPTGNAPSDRR